MRRPMKKRCFGSLNFFHYLAYVVIARTSIIVGISIVPCPVGALVCFKPN